MTGLLDLSFNMEGVQEGRGRPGPNTSLGPANRVLDSRSIHTEAIPPGKEGPSVQHLRIPVSVNMR